MDDETFNKVRDEVTTVGISHMGDFEEIDRQSLAIFQRYGTTEAEYDRRLEANLRELRRWRDSGFKRDGHKSNRKLPILFLLVIAALIIVLVGALLLKSFI